MALKSVLLVTVCFLVSNAAPSPGERRKRFGASVTLDCDGSAYRLSRDDELDVLWQTAEGEKVALYAHGVLSVGPRFEDRVTFHTGKIRRGDFSITIGSLVFSDEDAYECVWGKGQDSEKVLSNVKLYVVEPSFLKSHSISSGHPVTLPCFGPVPKKVPDNKLYVQWKKGDELILRLRSGEFTFGRMLAGRASMSLDMIRLGNFSLSLSVTGFADGGEYQCSCEENRLITSISLNVRDFQILAVVEPGCTFDISVPRVEVKVFFLKEGTDVPVCETFIDYSKCDTGYRVRAAYKEGTLQIRDVKPSDGGRYSVKEYHHGFLIKEVSLKVNADFPLGLYMCSLVVSVCLVALVMRKLRCGPKEMLGLCSHFAHL